MKNYQFTVVIQQDEEGNFIAICPALQGCYTEGTSKEEAFMYLQDAIRLHIDDRIERREPIFEEVFSDKIMIAASATNISN